MQDTNNTQAVINSANEEMKNKYLTFWTDGQIFGVPICDVVQIIGLQEITPVPEAPSYSKGIINLRGNIFPVIDVRLRFHKPEAEYDERTCIIVTNINNSYFGFIVDSVDEVTNIEESEISPPPSLSITSSSYNAYLTGVGKLKDKVVLLLDTSKILSEEEFETVQRSIPPFAQ
ncbi:MAG: chemotaxis protein CheW [Clostridiales bacterium]|nr:chemotaxis protein CheW [Clostridiales bacterium]